MKTSISITPGTVGLHWKERDVPEPEYQEDQKKKLTRNFSNILFYFYQILSSIFVKDKEFLKIPNTMI